MRDPAYYRTLPYRRVVDKRVDPNGDTYFIARVAEIPPLRIHGESREAALLKLDEIFDDIIQSMIDSGEDIPEPAQWTAAPQNTDSAAWQPSVAAAAGVYVTRLATKTGPFADVELSQNAGPAVAGVS